MFSLEIFSISLNIFFTQPGRKRNPYRVTDLLCHLSQLYLHLFLHLHFHLLEPTAAVPCPGITPGAVGSQARLPNRCTTALPRGEERLLTADCRLDPTQHRSVHLQLRYKRMLHCTPAHQIALDTDSSSSLVTGRGVSLTLGQEELLERWAGLLSSIPEASAWKAGPSTDDRRFSWHASLPSRPSLQLMSIRQTVSCLPPDPPNQQLVLFPQSKQSRIGPA